jgi:hypothetical protein
MLGSPIEKQFTIGIGERGAAKSGHDRATFAADVDADLYLSA